MKKIELSNGLPLEMDETLFDDMELLEELVQIEKGDVSPLPNVASKIFGPDKKRVYDSFRDEKGRVRVSVVMEEIKSIVTKLGQKNS